MSEKKKLFLVYIAVLSTMIIWGTSFVWSKIALEYYSSFTIVFFRLVISSIILILISVISRNFVRLEKKHIPIFLLLSLFQPFLYFIGETTGLNYVSPPVAAILIALIPLLTPFAALIFLSEKISILNFVGIIISLLGIILVIFEKDLSLIIAWEGLALMFLAVFAAISYAIIVKKLPAKYSAFNIVLYQNIIGMFYFLPIVLIFFTDNIIEVGFNKNVFIVILQLGFFASTIAFLLFVYALKRLSITKVNVFTNVIPVFTLIVSWILLKDMILWHQIIGVFIVITGVTVSQLRFKRKKNKNV